MPISIDYLVVADNAVAFAVLLGQILHDTYEALYEEVPEAAALQASVEIRYSHALANNRMAHGISVSVDDAVADDVGAESVVRELTQRLLGANDLGLHHAIKCGDPVMLNGHQQLAQEIFEFEMKLREALTLIFVDKVSEEYYELLDTCAVRFGERPLEQQMRAAGENQFFHILFSDYTGLERKVPNEGAALRKAIIESEDFESLKNRLSPTLPLGENYLDFLAQVRAYLNAVEKVRNAVMHNRAVPSAARQDYETARAPLRQALKDFFTSLS